MALTVIFGAGASFDSALSLPPQSGDAEPDAWGGAQAGNRPPLARQLFAQRFAELGERYPVCLGLLARIDLLPRGKQFSVEQQLDLIAQEAERNDRIVAQLVALRYYIRDVLRQTTDDWHARTRGRTCYMALLEAIDRWRHESGETVYLVTFNYDLLLDYAFTAALALPLDTLDDYISNPHYRLLKLHGSIDWLHRVRKIPEEHREPRLRDSSTWEDLEQPLAMRLHAIATKLEWTRTYTKEYPSQKIQEGVGYLPAIAIPTTYKLYFECPEKHLNIARAELPSANKTLIIGWRGMEKHFLNIWYPDHRRNIGDVCIVDATPQEATKVADHLTGEVGIKMSSIRTFGGFSRFLRKNEHWDFLCA